MRFEMTSGEAGEIAAPCEEMSRVTQGAEDEEAIFLRRDCWCVCLELGVEDIEGPAVVEDNAVSMTGISLARLAAFFKVFFSFLSGGPRSQMSGPDARSKVALKGQ